ncbi:hypothetical protein E2C01_073377 [Portunus trituberculatus]|uniref:Uncharacterized protein n=1 Tax=Portunus trituberculatus TaxID=210409 RepID=A0A5B7I9L3_PORTR|nr:hypothetical protein [Portunus trituberculatus]
MRLSITSVFSPLALINRTAASDKPSEPRLDRGDLTSSCSFLRVITRISGDPLRLQCHLEAASTNRSVGLILPAGSLTVL